MSDVYVLNAIKYQGIHSKFEKEVNLSWISKLLCVCWIDEW